MSVTPISVKKEMKWKLRDQTNTYFGCYFCKNNIKINCKKMCSIRLKFCFFENAAYWMKYVMAEYIRKWIIVSAS